MTIEEMSVEQYKAMLKKPPRRNRVVLDTCQGEDVISELELAFIQAWDGPDFIYQHQPIPKRKFRCDFAWPERKLIVEIQGGTWKGIGHGQASGIARDYARHNTLVAHGWRVLYYGADRLRGEALRETVAEVKRCLGAK